MRTKRPDARADIAHAASPRCCSKIFAAVQPASWKRPFNGTNYGEFQTDPSQHTIQIHTLRIFETFAASAKDGSRPVYHWCVRMEEWDFAAGLH